MPIYAGAIICVPSMECRPLKRATGLRCYRQQQEAVGRLKLAVNTRRLFEYRYHMTRAATSTTAVRLMHNNGCRKRICGQRGHVGQPLQRRKPVREARIFDSPSATAACTVHVYAHTWMAQVCKVLIISGLWHFYCFQLGFDMLCAVHICLHCQFGCV